MAEYITTTEQETEKVAREFANTLSDGDVIAFRGGLGAGKTAFTRGLGEGLGVTDPVSSPTFAIASVYRGGRLLLAHFDMYRISGMDELEAVGYYDLMEQNRGIVYAVEWSENIKDALPDDVITVEIKRMGDTTRRITIERGRD